MVNTCLWATNSGQINKLGLTKSQPLNKSGFDTSKGLGLGEVSKHLSGLYKINILVEGMLLYLSSILAIKIILCRKKPYFSIYLVFEGQVLKRSENHIRRTHQKITNSMDFKNLGI